MITLAVSVLYVAVTVTSSPPAGINACEAVSDLTFTVVDATPEPLVRAEALPIVIKSGRDVVNVVE